MLIPSHPKLDVVINTEMAKVNVTAIFDNSSGITGVRLGQVTPDRGLDGRVDFRQTCRLPW